MGIGRLRQLILENSRIECLCLSGILGICCVRLPVLVPYRIEHVCEITLYLKFFQWSEGQFRSSGQIVLDILIPVRSLVNDGSVSVHHARIAERCHIYA